ncbi:hypothetical protein LWI28_022953 [Acer negundo]|uniref:Uncharacterized protein n=1 Tax=Acer negundo TaxID=4023 RepID=A0AAD5J696_ACENE|nr:hypothetical protein LWI28_022953 [Acer negundo]
MASKTEDVEEVARTIDKEVLEAHKMMQLASTQRMNTDARRGIFCIIMSGEDYIDAFEKLLRPDFPAKQVDIFYPLGPLQRAGVDVAYKIDAPSKIIVEMVASFTLSLAVLKSIDFSDSQLLTPKRIMHFRMLFEAIFEYPDNLVWNIFTGIVVTPQLETLRNGIEFFVKEYVVKTN